MKRREIEKLTVICPSNLQARASNTERNKGGNNNNNNNNKSILEVWSRDYGDADADEGQQQLIGTQRRHQYYKHKHKHKHKSKEKVQHRRDDCGKGNNKQQTESIVEKDDMKQSIIHEDKCQWKGLLMVVL